MEYQNSDSTGGYNNSSNHENQNIVSSRVIKAGKRTYYLDIRTTRGGDYYLTITERKTSYSNDGYVKKEKHKVFVYKEDIFKFVTSIKELLNEMQKLLPEHNFEEYHREEEEKDSY